MMFNWNDQDQVGGTLWPDLTESEDHIVPHPMETRDNTSIPVEDYRKNKRDEGLAAMRPTEQVSQATNDSHCFKLEGSSNFHTNEELSSPRIETDSLFDFPNLSIELKDELIDGNSHNAMTELLDDIPDGTTLNSTIGDSMQLDHGPNLFGHEDNGSNDFLDCDWATFGDFDDIEKLFRKNDSIFGVDVIGDADGILSPSKDVIDSTVQSIPMPDLPSCEDCKSDEGCLSFQLDHHSVKQISPVKKEEADGHKITPRRQNEAKERKRDRPSRNLKDNYNQSQLMPTANTYYSVTTPSETFQSKAVSQQMQTGDAMLMEQHGSSTASQQMQFVDAKLVENHGSSNNLAFIRHECPTYYYPGIQLPPHLQTARIQKKPVLSSYRAVSDNTKSLRTPNGLPDAKAGVMTPQEKVEKLRRLQQMQAQVAIKQQHQQYSHQSAGVNITQSFSQNNQTLDAMTSTVTTDDAHKVSPSEQKMAVEQDESKRTSSLTYGPPVEETTYYQLQDVIGKLDMRVRLSIRDSLFRLARSARERQSASDRNSTNTSSKDEDEVSTEEESRYHDQSTRLAVSETDTNPIDRIVANLLFQRPT